MKRSMIQTRKSRGRGREEASEGDRRTESDLVTEIDRLIERIEATEASVTWD
jgi:hypothetical protein